MGGFRSTASWYVRFRPRYPAELIALLEKVTPEDIQRVAQEFFQPERIAASVVGNLDGFELTREQLTF